MTDHRFFLISGHMRNGNRMLASILMRAGCRGWNRLGQPDASTIPARDGTPFVTYRHLHPEQYIRRARMLGYHAVGIILVREPHAAAMSFVRSGDNRGHGYDQTINGRWNDLKANVKSLAAHRVPCEVVTYEGLQHPAAVHHLLTRLKLPTDTLHQPLPPTERDRGYTFVRPAETNQRYYDGRHGRIVFTNGCFDVFHAGHAALLQFCRTLGDWVIVGLNSDASVRRLKGESRPVNSQDARALVLQSCQYVDEVIVFDDDTPLELIEKVQPHVLVKGPDYHMSRPVGSEEVLLRGGEVVVFTESPFPDVSTTGILSLKVTGRRPKRPDSQTGVHRRSGSCDCSTAVSRLAMSREVTAHKVNGLNEALLVNVLDEPGQGNACHEYQIRQWEKDKDDIELCNVRFQNGPIGEVGVNGISNEALLAIVEDRLKGFQSGDYACRENALALTKLQEAMMWLHSRTRARVDRGVEGTHQV